MSQPKPAKSLCGPPVNGQTHQGPDVVPVDKLTTKHPQGYTSPSAIAVDQRVEFHNGAESEAG
eukprot:4371306-Prorocentrum_lima.AAC.1